MANYLLIYLLYSDKMGADYPQISRQVSGRQNGRYWTTHVRGADARMLTPTWPDKTSSLPMRSLSDNIVSELAGNDEKENSRELIISDRHNLSEKKCSRISARIGQNSRIWARSLVGKFRQVTEDATSDLCTDRGCDKYPVVRPDILTLATCRTDNCRMTCRILFSTQVTCRF